MQEKNPNKKNRVLVVCGLALLILVVIVTSIVLNFKKQKRDQLQDDNQQIEDALPDGAELRRRVCDSESVLLVDNYDNE